MFSMWSKKLNRLDWVKFPYWKTYYNAAYIFEKSVKCDCGARNTSCPYFEAHPLFTHSKMNKWFHCTNLRIFFNLINNWITWYRGHWFLFTDFKWAETFIALVIVKQRKCDVTKAWNFNRSQYNDIYLKACLWSSLRRVMFPWNVATNGAHDFWQLYRIFVTFISHFRFCTSFPVLCDSETTLLINGEQNKTAKIDVPFPSNSIPPCSMTLPLRQCDTPPFCRTKTECTHGLFDLSPGA